MTNVADPDVATFEEFEETILSEIEEGNPSTVDKGRRFIAEMERHLIDVTIDDAARIWHPDGPGDGGIDLAYLYAASDVVEYDDPDMDVNGDVWYIIQSKYGSADASTLLAESRKVLNTLTDAEVSLNQDARDLRDTLSIFMDNASENDKIILSFWSMEPCGDPERRAMDEIKTLATARLSSRTKAHFDMEWLSLRDAYDRVRSLSNPSLRVSISGSFMAPESEPGFHVGVVSLLNMHQFLEQYEKETRNLDKIYSKNVRQFLRLTNKVNKGIRDTLLDNPEMFGLYNNGITIVADGVIDNGNSELDLADPYIVNGCQTTKTIWETFNKVLHAGGTDESDASKRQREMWGNGLLIMKVVDAAKIGDSINSDESLIDRITRFTNNQTAVRAQDFLTLERDVRDWQRSFHREYGIYLEVQKGGWSSQKAIQKRSDYSGQKFSEYVNAFDLIQVYGAGWLMEPGSAFGRKNLFAPGGPLYIKITTDGEFPSERRFDHRDLYAAYALHMAADQFRFGRRAEKQSRRQTKFLFCHVVLALLRSSLLNAGVSTDWGTLTDTIIAMAQAGEGTDAAQSWHLLLDQAVYEVDEYANLGNMEESALTLVHEEEFKHHGNLNTFLKSPQLGKATGPQLLLDAIRTANRVFYRSGRDGRNPGQMVAYVANSLGQG